MKHEQYGTLASIFLWVAFDSILWHLKLNRKAIVTPIRVPIKTQLEKKQNQGHIRLEPEPAQPTS